MTLTPKLPVLEASACVWGLRSISNSPYPQSISGSLQGAAGIVNVPMRMSDLPSGTLPLCGGAVPARLPSNLGFRVEGINRYGCTLSVQKNRTSCWKLWLLQSLGEALSHSRLSFPFFRKRTLEQRNPEDLLF